MMIHHQYSGLYELSYQSSDSKIRKEEWPQVGQPMYYIYPEFLQELGAEAEAEEEAQALAGEAVITDCFFPVARISIQELC